VDSAWIDFSKGLGAPVGACLAGTRAFIEEAWRYKQALGGAMRQAGIIAAGGVYALRHHVDRLALDHENARILARGIAGLPGIALDPTHVETNIVILDVAGTGLTAQTLADRLFAEAQVRLSVMGESRLRAVTHLDVSRKQIDAAVEAFARVLTKR
jgi:threonine aldolase